jgi:hypothetical protein
MLATPLTPSGFAFRLMSNRFDSRCIGQPFSESNSGRVSGGIIVSIVRVGLAETKNFAEGFDAIFGKKKAPVAKKPKQAAKKSAGQKKKSKKRSAR